MDNSYTPLKSYLTSQGKDFSQANLKTLATEKGLTSYTGTDAENNKLASLINTTPNLPSVISADSLNTKAIQVPTLNTPITPTIPTPNNQADQILKDTAVADTALQTKGNDLSFQIANLLPELQGKSAALASEQEKLGLGKLKKSLQDLNSEILVKSAEINKSDIELAQSLQTIEDKPIAMEFITGQQASVQRNAQLARALKMAEIGVLNARVLGTQGNIALANDMATQAVNAKYAPIQEAIDTYKAQLEAIQPLLTRDEKKQAAAQELRTKLALDDIATRKQQEKDVQSLVINASSQGAPSSLVSAASKAKTPTEAAQILGQYAGNYLQNQLLKAQISKQYADTAKVKADIAKTYSKLNVNSPISAKTSAAQSTLDLIKELANNPGKDAAVGVGFKKTIVGSLPFVSGEAIPGTDRANFEFKFNQLKDSLALTNIDKLKGAMSDKDIEFLRNTGSALNLNMSEEAFNEELAKVAKVMAAVPGVIDIESSGNSAQDAWYINTSKAVSNIGNTPVSAASYGFTNNQQ